MRTFLVTGANRGLGLEFVKQYTDAGHRVFATCRDPESSNELSDLARQRNSLIQVERLDVTDGQAIGELARRIGDEPIDVLINNAGLLSPEPILENFPRQHFGSMDYELWAEIVRINTFGPIRMAEAFVENVARSEEKKIICLSSSVGSIGSRRTPSVAYPSSKAALNKAVSLLADQLKGRGITCIALCPGHVKTRMVPSCASVQPLKIVRSFLFVRGWKRSWPSWTRRSVTKC